MICDGGGGRVFWIGRSEVGGRDGRSERAVGCEGSFRGRLAGRASNSSPSRAALTDLSVGLVLRLATRLAFALRWKVNFAYFQTRKGHTGLSIDPLS